jgi:hypothetical protein
MKKHIIAAAIVVASLVYSTILIAQPSPGFSKTAPIQGTGSSGSPIAITACSAGSGYVHSGAAWACALIGDITGITAGSGVHASSTTASGAATLAIDPTYTQRRISTDCGAGSAVRSVAEDGTPTCISAGGSITAGTNIDVSGSTVNVEPSVTLAGESNTDTLDVNNSAAAQTASIKGADVAMSGTFDVTGGALTIYGVSSVMTTNKSASSASANSYINIAGRFQAEQTVDVNTNYGVYATAANIDTGACPLCETEGSLPAAYGIYASATGDLSFSGFFDEGTFWVNGGAIFNAGMQVSGGDIDASGLDVSGHTVLGSDNADDLTVNADANFVSNTIIGSDGSDTLTVNAVPTFERNTAIVGNLTAGFDGDGPSNSHTVYGDLTVLADGDGTDGAFTAPIITTKNLRGTQTDASVSGTQTDWALSDSSTVFRINFTASTDVLSIANGAAGREIEIINVGSATPRFFSDYAVGTTAAMRIVLDATYSYLAPGAGLKLRYDATSSRWRQVSNSSFYVYRLTTVNNLTADGSFEALTSAVNTYQPFTTTVTANLGDGDADIVNIRGVAKDTSTAVAPTTCGTSPTVTGGSTAFVVTTGSGATGCILTFSGTKTNVPTCVVSGQNSTEFAYTVSATAITLGSGTAASTKYDVICVGDG